MNNLFKRTSSIVLSLALVVFLSMGAFGTVAKAAMDNKLHVYYLNVGQADATLIEYNNQYMLIDAGMYKDTGESKYENLRTFLDEKGVTKLDYVVITHFDSDHVVGLKNALVGNGSTDRRIQVGKFLAKKYVKGYGNYEKMEDFQSQSPVFVNYNTFSDLLSTYYPGVAWESPYYSTTTGKYTFAGAVNLEFLNKKDSYIELVSKGEIDLFKKHVNNDSLVFKMTYNTKTFLFTGDIGQTAAGDLNALHGSKLTSGILKLPHHGLNLISQSVFSNFFATVNPGITVGMTADSVNGDFSILKNYKLGKTYLTSRIGTYVSNPNDTFMGIQIDTDGSTAYVTKSAITFNSQTLNNVGLNNSETFQ